MKKYINILWMLALLLCMAGKSAAQEVMVTVSPVNQILPPQALNYLDNPGKYFNISLINTSDEALNIYIGLEVEQIMPNDGISLSTPPKRMPNKPLVLAPRQSKTLSLIESKNLFAQLNLAEVNMTGALLTDYTGGNMALLPEGTYRGHITVYQYDPSLTTPRVLSNPHQGSCTFQICYQAQAPQFVEPVKLFPASDDLSGLESAVLDLSNPRFIWTEPSTACGGVAHQFKYDFKIVKMLPGQTADEAISQDLVVYQRNALLTPQCVIPSASLKNFFDAEGHYVALVKGYSSAKEGDLNYVAVINNGFSRPLIVRQKKDAIAGTEVPETGGGSVPAELYSMSGVVFTKPKIKEKEVNTLSSSIGDDIVMSWSEQEKLGGRGTKSDTLKFHYNVRVVEMSTGMTAADIFKVKPIFEKKEVSETTYTVKWDDIKDKFRSGALLAAAVEVKCTNKLAKGDTVIFARPSANFDVVYTPSLSEKYPDCSPDAEVENKEVADFSSDQLKNMTVAIGQYNMVLTKVTKNKDRSLKGNGYMVWEPAGYKIKVSVEFDSLYVNSDKVVFRGTAKSCKDFSDGADVIPYDLFDEWGLKNLLGESSQVYGEKIKQYISKSSKIDQYYRLARQGKRRLQNLLNGEAEISLPISLSDAYNESPVDIEIISMQFSPTTAWMNVMGMFALPNCKEYTANNVVIMGAPRLCMEPGQFIPGTGSMAILSDVSLKDPASRYEFRFKAPSSFSKPENGCFVGWENGKFGQFNIEFEMNVPGLLKDDGKGNIVGEGIAPAINMKASIRSWDDWTASGRMDPFQIVGVSGMTFVVGDKDGIYYDHSPSVNPSGLKKMPEGYNLSKLTSLSEYSNDNVNKWEGLYIDKVSMLFPKVISYSAGEKDGEEAKTVDKRLALSMTNFLADESGISLSLSLDNVFSAQHYTGNATVGGWKITLDKIYVTILQGQFGKAGFEGTFRVPFFNGDVGYSASMLYQNFDDGTKGFYYLFKTQQVDKLQFDFFLGKCDFVKENTYFQVEMTDRKSDKVQLELCMAGKITIAGTKSITNAVGFKMPGIEFEGFRLSNTKKWKSYAGTIGDLMTDHKKSVEEAGSDKETGTTGTGGTTGTTDTTGTSGTTNETAQDADTVVDSSEDSVDDNTATGGENTGSDDAETSSDSNAPVGGSGAAGGVSGGISGGAGATSTTSSGYKKNGVDYGSKQNYNAFQAFVKKFYEEHPDLKETIIISFDLNKGNPKYVFSSTVSSMVGSLWYQPGDKLYHYGPDATDTADTYEKALKALTSPKQEQTSTMGDNPYASENAYNAFVEDFFKQNPSLKGKVQILPEQNKGKMRYYISEDGKAGKEDIYFEDGKYYAYLTADFLSVFQSYAQASYMYQMAYGHYVVSGVDYRSKEIYTDFQQFLAKIADESESDEPDYAVEFPANPEKDGFRILYKIKHRELKGVLTYDDTKYSSRQGYYIGENDIYSKYGEAKYDYYISRENYQKYLKFCSDFYTANPSQRSVLDIEYERINDKQFKYVFIQQKNKKPADIWYMPSEGKYYYKIGNDTRTASSFEMVHYYTTIESSSYVNDRLEYKTKEFYDEVVKVCKKLDEYVTTYHFLIRYYDYHSGKVCFRLSTLAGLKVYYIIDKYAADYGKFIVGTEVVSSAKEAVRKATVLAQKKPAQQEYYDVLDDYYYNDKKLTPPAGNFSSKAFDEALLAYAHGPMASAMPDAEPFEAPAGAPAAAPAPALSHTFSQIEFGEGENKIYLDLGTWGFASPSKKIGGFSFSLEEISLTKNGGDMGLRLKGKIGMLDGKLSAGAGVTVWATVDGDNYFDAKFKEVTFDEASFDASLAGLTVAGKLKVVKEKGMSGYCGMLSIALPGDFLKMTARGGYFDQDKTASDIDKDLAVKAKGQYAALSREEQIAKLNINDSFSWGYFEIEMESKAGVQIPPIQINGLTGGFYFNCCKTGDKVPETGTYGVMGGLIGLKIATSDGKLISGSMSLVVCYDMYGGSKHQGQLSSIVLKGTVSALTAVGDEGLITAQAMLRYINTYDKKTKKGDRYFQLTLDVKAGGDLSEMLEQVTGVKLDNLLPNVGLDELGAKDEEGNKKASDNKDKGDNRKAKASYGLTLTLDLKITQYEAGEKVDKWHLWVGKPNPKERCKLTLIDFQVGSRKGGIGMWAYQGGGAYLCLGNELPDGGALPPLPERIQKLLDGKDVNGNQQRLSNGAKNAISEVMQKTSKGRGGVMFGINAEGEFGINAAVVYVDVWGCIGFDLALIQTKGAMCDGKPMGRKGWYATGQVYAGLEGEIGLMIDLWIFSGKLPLVEVGLGAMLRGGAPNPAWVYGKVRARASLLGGLVKFNKSIVLKAGKVCLPEFANPLDDVQIFGDMKPGSMVIDGDHESARADGWEDKDARVLPITSMSFTTNMKIGSDIRLLDERRQNMNAGMSGSLEDNILNSERVYRFMLDYDSILLQRFAKPGDKTPVTTHKATVTTRDNINFAVSGGVLEMESYYKLLLRGYCEEKHNGRWGKPWFRENGRDVQREWRDGAESYFATSTLPPTLEHRVYRAFPRGNTSGWSPRSSFVLSNLPHILTDITNPLIVLKYPMDDVFRDYEVVCRIDEYVDRSGEFTSAAASAQLAEGYHLSYVRTICEDVPVDYYNNGTYAYIKPRVNVDGNIFKRNPYIGTYYSAKKPIFSLLLYRVDKRTMAADIEKGKQKIKLQRAELLKEEMIEYTEPKTGSGSTGMTLAGVTTSTTPTNVLGIITFKPGVKSGVTLKTSGTATPHVIEETTMTRATVGTTMTRATVGTMMTSATGGTTMTRVTGGTTMTRVTGGTTITRVTGGSDPMVILDKGEVQDLGSVFADYRKELTQEVLKHDSLEQAYREYEKNFDKSPYYSLIYQSWWKYGRYDDFFKYYESNPSLAEGDRTNEPFYVGLDKIEYRKTPSGYSNTNIYDNNAVFEDPFYYLSFTANVMAMSNYYIGKYDYCHAFTGNYMPVKIGNADLHPYMSTVINPVWINIREDVGSHRTNEEFEYSSWDYRNKKLEGKSHFVSMSDGARLSFANTAGGPVGDMLKNYASLSERLSDELNKVFEEFDKIKKNDKRRSWIKERYKNTFTVCSEKTYGDKKYYPLIEVPYLHIPITRAIDNRVYKTNVSLWRSQRSFGSKYKERPFKTSTYLNNIKDIHYYVFRPNAFNLKYQMPTVNTLLPGYVKSYHTGGASGAMKPK